MSFELFSNLVAAFFTLCIFSFLYKDNPLYQMAEQLLVGISLGYSLVFTYERIFIPYIWQPIVLKHNFILIFPTLLGILYLFRFSRKLGWLSRYPIAFSMIGIGLGVPLGIHAGILVQMRQAMVPVENINLFLILLGTIAVLLYFFFSKAHTGAYGKFVGIGKWYMMIGFGASFGMTVMARISLLIGRIQFLVIDVLGLMK
ncbi:MAG TPA: hypothetical protein P5518_03400 [Candidatus Cloacimonas sp.]|jgi:hypothetical protein|nr:hypothetical protein [Candidatus Cloacimonas sp.]MDD2250587.1 hypothetical protein [Candidatus Cloacimonadota bacterium]MCK9165222.1 hypothetical protein [Candidatus Cloacimonas sp.]MDD3734691.1 hypothetical protein [Candidatus Cloacimonadota bacterium]MDD3869502.1 hypothetical protein [Candidatus Cloacimonadota bacterium]